MGIRDGRAFLGMIVAKGNIENLMKGMPIHFNVEQLGISEIKCKEVVIMYYETQEEAMEHLKNNDLLDNTRIIRESDTKQ